jgi:hypothetical protein
MNEGRSSILSGEAEAPAPRRRRSVRGGLAAFPIRREETRTTDHRGEDRHRDLVERSTIHFRRGKHAARVVNVSSRGAMIEAAIDPRIGEALDIVLTGSARTRCAVRWVRDGRIGLEFVDETIVWNVDSPVAPVFRYEGEGRETREARRDLLCDGTLYWSGITVKVRLRNVSAGGARIESERDLLPGAMVELDLGDAGIQVAEIRWSNDGQIGLRFAAGIDLDRLGATTEAAGQGAKPYHETAPSPDSPWAAHIRRLAAAGFAFEE